MRWQDWSVQSEGGPFFANRILTLRLLTRQNPLALLVLAGSTIGYLFAQALNLANACYHRRVAKNKRLARNG